MQTEFMQVSQYLIKSFTRQKKHILVTTQEDFIRDLISAEGLSRVFLDLESDSAYFFLFEFFETQATAFKNKKRPETFF